MQVIKLVKTEQGKIIMSIILGFGLATLFRSACRGKKCTVKVAPDFDEIEDQSYSFGDKCFKFVRETVKCNKRVETANIV